MNYNYFVDPMDKTLYRSQDDPDFPGMVDPGTLELWSDGDNWTDYRNPEENVFTTLRRIDEPELKERMKIAASGEHR